MKNYFLKVTEIFCMWMCNYNLDRGLREGEKLEVYIYRRRKFGIELGKEIRRIKQKQENYAEKFEF
jgi:hypothetical protein